MEAGGTILKGKIVNSNRQGRSSSAGWQMTSIMKISNLKMERKRSGIPGRKKSDMPFLEIRRRVPM